MLFLGNAINYACALKITEKYETKRSGFSDNIMQTMWQICLNPVKHRTK